MRLIDADALLEKMKKTDRYFNIKFDIEDAPTVDAVEVVRCKDCRYFDENDCLEQFYWCNFSEDRRTPDDFCSYGESGARMDGE